MSVWWWWWCSASCVLLGVLLLGVLLLGVLLLCVLLLGVLLPSVLLHWHFYWARISQGAFLRYFIEGEEGKVKGKIDENLYLLT